MQMDLDAQTIDPGSISATMQEKIMSWNASLPDLVDECVHDGIVKQCLKSPSAQAICAWDGVFTYQDLNELSLSLAIHLQSLGVGPEVFVPILSEKSKWAPLATVGVIRAGGAAVLLDPSVPFLRLQTICKSVKAGVIISSSECEKLASRLASKVVCVGDNHISWHQQRGGVDLVNDVTPRNALYAVFTSGSTGEPKGIVVEHASFSTWAVATYEPKHVLPNVRTLQFVSHMFDPCMGDYLQFLLAGGCLCIASQSDLRDNIPKAIEDLKANRLHLTPSLALTLRPEQVPRIETLLLGGEAWTRRNVETWAGKLRLLQGYGPAECTVTCTAAKVGTQSEPNNIGYATGCVAWIVDENDHDKLVPIGAVGELLIEGHTVSRGYLNDPAKTAASFISAPVWLRGLRPKSRLYKTGDLVQYDDDGSLLILGRKDTQVKIRGQRVELEEVQHHVRQAHASFDSVIAEVISPSYMTASQILAVFTYVQQAAKNDQWTAKQKDQLNLFQPANSEIHEIARRVLNILQERLPSYMIPNLLIPLARMPLSATGKLDRRLLREQAANLSKAELETYQIKYVVTRLPENASEKALQGVVAEVLNLSTEDVGMDDDFFRLGGDSIVAIRFVEKAQKAGFAFRVTNLFQTPQLSQLAAIARKSSADGTDRNGTSSSQYFDRNDIDRIMQSLNTSGSFSIIPDDLQEVLPVTQAAERFVFMPPEYWVWSLQGPIDHGKLHRACSGLVERHAALRTIFVLHKDSLVQVVLTHLAIDLESSTTTFSIKEFVERYRRNDKVTAPTVDVPVIKFIFVQNAQGQQGLVVRISHGQYDAFGMRTLWQDLQHLYEGVTLPPAMDYALHIRAWKDSQTESTYAFWRELLQGSTPSRIDNTTLCGTRQEPTQSKRQRVTTTRRVKYQPSDVQDVTTATIIKAAWSYLLAELTHQDDIVFVQYSNGRNNESAVTTDMVGMRLNYIPVRAKVDSRSTALYLMRLIQRQHYETFDFELCDFRNIVEHATPWPKGATHQSAVLHQNIEPITTSSLGEAQAQISCSFEWPTPLNEIMIETKPLANGDLQLTFDTMSDTLSRHHAELVLERLCRLISLFQSNSGDSLKKIGSFVGSFQCQCHNI